MLTLRDIDVLEHITARRGVPIEYVAARFFAADPFTGKQNRNPTRACEQCARSSALATLGSSDNMTGASGDSSWFLRAV